MPIDIDRLKRELNGDPLVRGYSGMTDQQASDDLNAITRPANIPTQAQMLTMASDNTMGETCTLGKIAFMRESRCDPTAIESAIAAITLTTLTPNVQSRAQEISLGSKVRPGNVAEARD